MSTLTTMTVPTRPDAAERVTQAKKTSGLAVSYFSISKKYAQLIQQERSVRGGTRARLDTIAAAERKTLAR